MIIGVDSVKYIQNLIRVKKSRLEKRERERDKLGALECCPIRNLFSSSYQLSRFVVIICTSTISADTNREYIIHNAEITEWVDSFPRGELLPSNRILIFLFATISWLLLLLRTVSIREQSVASWCLSRFIHLSSCNYNYF